MALVTTASHNYRVSEPWLRREAAPPGLQTICPKKSQSNVYPSVSYTLFLCSEIRALYFNKEPAAYINHKSNCMLF